MKLLYSYIRRLCAYITDRLYQFKRFLLLSIDVLGLSYPVFTKVTGILPVALVCFHFVCFAQESPVDREATGIGEIKPLMVGQKVPEEFWTKEHLFYVNGDTMRRTLEEYRGKLLVLGFWATWCSSCLKNSSMIESILDEKSDEIAYVKVNSLKTKDRLNQIVKFINGPLGANYSLDKNSFTSIIHDFTLNEFFPNIGYPLYIWIYNNNIHTITYQNLFNRKLYSQLFRNDL